METISTGRSIAFGVQMTLLGASTIVTAMALVLPLSPGDTPLYAIGTRGVTALLLVVSAVSAWRRDVQQRQAAERCLQRRELLTHHLCSQGVGVSYIKSLTDTWELIYVSDNCGERLGLLPADLLGGPDRWADRIHPDDRKAVVQALSGHPLRQGGAIEYRLRRGDGTYCWVRDQAHRVESWEGFPEQVVGTWTDLESERRLIQAEELLDQERVKTSQLSAENHLLAVKANHDALTGLPNRAHFNQVLYALAAQPDVAMVSLLYLDLDDFKLVNDTYGHNVGDQVLAQYAGRLRRCVPECWFVARLGGDEFVILSSGGDEDAETVAQTVSEQVRHPLVVGELLLNLSVSIGVATCNREAMSADPTILLAHADASLYAVKRCGKGNYQRFRMEGAANRS